MSISPYAIQLILYISIFIVFWEVSDPLIALLGIYALYSNWKIHNSIKQDKTETPILYCSVFALLLIIGLATSSVIVAALAWVLVSQFLFKRSPSFQIRSLILPIYALPWAQLDLVGLQVYLRLLYAWVVEHIHVFLGFPVIRDGVYLLIQGTPISIDPPCAGIHTWQIFVLTGSIIMQKHVKGPQLLFGPIILSFLAILLSIFRIFLSSMLIVMTDLEKLHSQLHLFIGLSLTILFLIPVLKGFFGKTFFRS